MSPRLVNQTLSRVVQEIENVLEEYPEHPYQSAFSMPEMRQKLITHILSHAPDRYVMEGSQELSSNAQVRHSSRLQKRLRMEMVIRGSILHILRENADWLSHHFPNV